MGATLNECFKHAEEQKPMRKSFARRLLYHFGFYYYFSCWLTHSRATTVRRWARHSRRQGVERGETVPFGATATFVPSSISFRNAHEFRSLKRVISFETHSFPQPNARQYEFMQNETNWRINISRNEQRINASGLRFDINDEFNYEFHICNWLSFVFRIELIRSKLCFLLRIEASGPSGSSLEKFSLKVSIARATCKQIPSSINLIRVFSPRNQTRRILLSGWFFFWDSLQIKEKMTRFFTLKRTRRNSQ